MRAASLMIFCLLAVAEPLTPEQARQKVGQAVTVQMTVQASKNALEKRGYIYLDSESDFRDAKNFTVVLNRTVAAKLKERGIADPAAHFRDKVIQATGTVEEDPEHKLPRIMLDDPDKIQIVEKKSA